MNTIAVATERQGLRPYVKSAVAAATEPRWPLAFLAILGYLIVQYSRLQQMYPVLQPLHLGKVFVILSIVGLLASPAVKVENRASRTIDKVMLVFLFFVFISALLAYSTKIGWDSFIDAITWVVTYYLLSRILTSAFRLRIFVLILLLLNFKLAQFVVRGYVTLESRGVSQKWLATQGVGAGSTDFFGNSADLGLAMVVVWVITGCLLMGEKKKSVKIFLWICFVGFFASILLCGSRGAIVGAVAAALVWWLRKPDKKIAGVLALLIFGIAIYFFLPEGMKAKLQSAEDWRHDSTAFHRTLLWRAGIRMFEHHPVFGVGVGNFGYAYFQDYPDFVLEEPVAHWYGRFAWVPHSIYIQSISETGLAGTIPLAMLCFLSFRTNSRTRKRLASLGMDNNDHFEYRLSIGLDLALVGYLASGAFIAVIYYPHLWFILGLSAGLNVAVLRLQSQAAASPEPVPQERKLALVAS